MSNNRGEEILKEMEAVNKRVDHLIETIEKNVRETREELQIRKEKIER